MHVQAAHLVRAGLQDAGAGPARRLPGGHQPAHGVEQEGAAAARRVQHALRQRRIDRSGDHAGGQPVRGVVLAQVVPLVRVDQAFVQDLQHVGLDVAQAEAGGALGDLSHQVGAGGQAERPVEEIRLDRAQDALIG